MRRNTYAPGNVACPMQLGQANAHSLEMVDELRRHGANLWVLLPEGSNWRARARDARGAAAKRER